MIERQADRPRAVTLGADKGYDAADFVNELRAMNVRPHVAQNNERRGGSAIDRRTTRHRGYGASQRIRKRIEEAFGWMKTIGGMRRPMLRGTERVGWAFTFAAARLQSGAAPEALGSHGGLRIIETNRDRSTAPTNADVPATPLATDRETAIFFNSLLVCCPASLFT